MPGIVKVIGRQHVVTIPGMEPLEGRAGLKVLPAEFAGNARIEMTGEAFCREWGDLAAGVRRFQTPDATLNRLLVRQCFDGYELTKRWKAANIPSTRSAIGGMGRHQRESGFTLWDLVGESATAALFGSIRSSPDRDSESRRHAPPRGLLSPT